MSQLPLAFGGLDAPDFENWWPGADPLALARLRALAAAPGAAQVLLCGGASHGKTHLLLATCEAARLAGFTVAYLPLDRLESESLTDPVDAELIAVDSVDRAIDGRNLAEWLFAQINRQHDLGHALLLAARRLPDTTGSILPDLNSRLALMEKLQLAPHDDDARKSILLHRAARAGIPLDAAAAEHLLRHCGRDLRGLLARLAELEREAMARGRRITVPLVRELLQAEDPRYRSW